MSNSEIRELVAWRVHVNESDELFIFKDKRAAYDFSKSSQGVIEEVAIVSVDKKAMFVEMLREFLRETMVDFAKSEADILVNGNPSGKEPKGLL